MSPEVWDSWFWNCTTPINQIISWNWVSRKSFSQACFHRWGEEWAHKWRTRRIHGVKFLSYVSVDIFLLIKLAFEASYFLSHTTHLKIVSLVPQVHRCHYGACPACQLPCGAILPCGHCCKERSLPLLDCDHALALLECLLSIFSSRRWTTLALNCWTEVGTIWAKKINYAAVLMKHEAWRLL